MQSWLRGAPAGAQARAEARAQGRQIDAFLEELKTRQAGEPQLPSNRRG